jgi:hypothetical protein
MPTERDDLHEHFDRYRAVTLSHLALLSDEHLSWRPHPEAFSIGQHFVHILQTEEFYIRGLFEGRWDPECMRFPTVLPGKSELAAQFGVIRNVTSKHFARLTACGSRILNSLAESRTEATLRSA